MTTAVIYSRISDDREGRELGVDDQVKHCRELACREGLTIIDDTYKDNDLSASSKARKPRPHYQRLLRDARAGRFQVIIALSSSRLTRRMREHEDLIDLAIQSGVKYLFVKSPSFDLNTADGQMVARILASADAAEAGRTAERVTLACARRAEKGEYHGGPRLYGFHGTAVDDDEAVTIRQWAAGILEGRTLHGLALDLNRRGVPSPGGAQWRPWVIRRILLNPRVAGLRVLNGTEYPGANAAIVPAEQWRAVVGILTADGRGSGRPTARKHVGTGLYRCEQCGQTVGTSVNPRGALLYKCKGGCWRTWLAEPVDAFVDDMVAARLARPDLADLLARPDDGPAIDTLRAEAASVRARLNQVAEEFADGTLTGDQLRVITIRLRTRLDEAEGKLADAGRSNPLAPLVNAADPVAAWKAVDDLERRRAIIDGLMTVVLSAPLRGRVPFDDRRLLGSSSWRGNPTSWRELP